MEIGAAEAIGADAGAAGETGGLGPFLQVMVEDEGGVAEIGVGVRLLGVQRRRQDSLVDGHDGLEKAGRASAGLEVANVALGRAQGNAAARRAGENLGQALQLDDVTYLGAGAVSFQQGGRGRVQAGVGPGALGRQDLADGVGGGDTLALAIAGAAHATDDGVDLVAVALRVGQALEQEGGGPFAHNKAIGAVAEGPAAGGAQRADLAELDKDAGAHVAVHAAGQHRIHLAGRQQFHRRVDGRETGGASRVGDEAGSAQVEHVGHPARDDVGQLAWHGVFGDGRQGGVHAFVPPGQNRLAHSGGQLLELRHRFQSIAILRELDAHGGDVVILAAHGRAQDHAGAVGVQRPVGIAVVGQRLGANGHGPLLALVHSCSHLGRNAVFLPVELKAPHPAADLAVRFVRRSRVGVVIVGNAPALRRSLADAITLVLDVLPKGRGRRRIGQDCPHANDGNGSLYGVTHGSNSSSIVNGQCSMSNCQCRDGLQGGRQPLTIEH